MSRGSFETRARQLGLIIPRAPQPVAQYVRCRQHGDMLFVSGQGPVRDGVPVIVGRVGEDVSVAKAYDAARLCALNAVAAAKLHLGSLDRLEGVIQVRGFVNSASDFHDQPVVVDGASDLLVELFGDSGRHARAALGTSNLPSNIPVEIEVIFAVEPCR